MLYLLCLISSSLVTTASSHSSRYAGTDISAKQAGQAGTKNQTINFSNFRFIF